MNIPVAVLDGKPAAESNLDFDITLSIWPGTSFVAESEIIIVSPGLPQL